MYYITINVQYVRYSTGRKIKYFIVLLYRLYYWLIYNDIMQSTDSLIVHFLSFSSLLNSLLFIACENPPNKCAKLTCQINAPKWPAKISCRENLPDSPARITRRIYLPEKPAISTCGLLARDPPFPAQNPQAGPGSPTLPPTPTAPPTERGVGAGRRPGPPTHIEQVLLLFFHVSWMITYSCKTQHIHILHRADWMKYKYYCRRRNNC